MTSNTWHFDACSKTGAIRATEPDGTRHTVTRGDMNTVAGHALLNAMVRDLAKALYTPVWLDMEGKAFGVVSDEQIEAALLTALADVRQRSGLDVGFCDNGADIEARLQRDATLDCPACGGSGHVDDAEPVAYGIFADIPDEGWVLQFPNYRERADAERMAGVFMTGAVLEVRPLYA